MSQFQEKRPTGQCPVCGKSVTMKTAKGGRNTPNFCSRVCASMKRYEKRFKGARSEMFIEAPDLEKKRHE